MTKLKWNAKEKVTKLMKKLDQKSLKPMTQSQKLKWNLVNILGLKQSLNYLQREKTRLKSTSG
jgi:hypothetical protein